MQVSFEIALHTGCRIRETRIPMNCIDFAENKITFPAPKGGEDRAFSIPMPTALRPLLARIAIRHDRGPITGWITSWDSQDRSAKRSITDGRPAPVAPLKTEESSPPIPGSETVEPEPLTRGKTCCEISRKGAEIYPPSSVSPRPQRYPVWMASARKITHSDSRRSGQFQEQSGKPTSHKTSHWRA